MYEFDKLWNYGNPSETEEKFRHLLPESPTRENRDFYLQLLTQIARTQSLQRKFDKAHEILDQVREILSAASEDPHPESYPVAEIRLFLERGRTFNSNGKRESAEPLFKQAWEKALEEREDFYAIDAAHMLAIVKGDEEDQIRWNEKALEVAESSDESRAGKWKGSLYNNLGWSYYDGGDYEKAEEMLQKSRDFHEKEGNEPNVEIARWSVAKVWRKKGDLEKALETQREILENRKKGGDSTALGYSHEEVGECLWAMGEEEKARPHFARAHEILSEDPWMVANEGDRLKSLFDRASGQ